LTDDQRDAIRRQLKKRADGAAVVVLFIGLHFVAPETMTWWIVLAVFIMTCAGGLIQWKFDTEK
jgi:hypothetical protein